MLQLLQFVGKCITFLFHGAHRFSHGKLQRHSTGVKIRFQFLNFRVFGCGSLLHFTTNLFPGEFNGIQLFLLGQLEPLMQLLLELGVPNLLQNVCIPGLINFECFLTMWANYLVHSGIVSFCLFWLDH